MCLKKLFCLNFDSLIFDSEYKKKQSSFAVILHSQLGNLTELIKIAQNGKAFIVLMGNFTTLE